MGGRGDRDSDSTRRQRALLNTIRLLRREMNHGESKQEKYFGLVCHIQSSADT